MVNVSTVALRQTAALWAATGNYDNDGDPEVAAVGSPVEIKVRWEEETQERVNEDATPIAITTTVFVDREILKGSVLRLGTVAGLPSPPDNLHEVVEYDEIPNIKGVNPQRCVVLQKRNKVLA